MPTQLPVVTTLLYMMVFVVAIGASATGARAYTATSSQGLLFMAEVLYNVSGLGLPIVREIAAITPGPWFHMGGDEVKTLSAADYERFVARVQGIVRSHGKQMIGWDEVAPTKLLSSGVTV